MTSTFGDLFLFLGQDFTFGHCGVALQGFESPGRNADANAAQTDGLEVDLLFSLGGNVGMAARVTAVGALSGKQIDAGHIRDVANHSLSCIFVQES